MPFSRPPGAPHAAPQLPPLKVAILLSRARSLQHTALNGPAPLLLSGRNLGLLCEAPPGEAQARFRRAAEELGARVAVMRSGLSLRSTAQEVQDMARVLGRLYDALECHGLDTTLVARIGQHAGIPVFDGAATDDHPVHQLADLLGDSSSQADKRRFLLQALLLEAIA